MHVVGFLATSFAGDDFSVPSELQEELAVSRLVVIVLYSALLCLLVYTVRFVLAYVLGGVEIHHSRLRFGGRFLPMLGFAVLAHGAYALALPTLGVSVAVFIYFGLKWLAYNTRWQGHQLRFEANIVAFYFLYIVWRIVFFLAGAITFGFVNALGIAYWDGWRARHLDINGQQLELDASVVERWLILFVQRAVLAALGAVLAIALIPLGAGAIALLLNGQPLAVFLVFWLIPLVLAIAFSWFLTLEMRWRSRGLRFAPSAQPPIPIQQDEDGYVEDIANNWKTWAIAYGSTVGVALISALLASFSNPIPGDFDLASSSSGNAVPSASSKAQPIVPPPPDTSRNEAASSKTGTFEQVLGMLPDVQTSPDKQDAFEEIHGRILALREPRNATTLDEIWRRMRELRTRIAAVADPAARKRLHEDLDALVLDAIEEEALDRYDEAADLYDAGEYAKTLAACERVFALYEGRDAPKLEVLKLESPEAMGLAEDLYAAAEMAQNPEQRFAVQGFFTAGGKEAVVIQDYLNGTRHTVAQDERLGDFTVERIDSKAGTATLRSGVETFRIRR